MSELAGIAAAIVILAGMLAASVLLPILSFVRASGAERIASELRRQLEALGHELQALRDTVGRLEATGRGATGSDGTSTSPGAAADVSPGDTRTGRANVPVPERVTEPPSKAAADQAPLAAAVDATAAQSRPPAPPARWGRDSRPSPISLENRIGARWLLYIGIAALVLGASYFVRYAFENDWITAGMQVALGFVAGLALVEAGRQLAGRGAPFYGQIVAGGGCAIAFVSAYAAYQYYGLIGARAAFSLLLGVAALAAVVADAQRAPGLAIVAVAGGFVTPFLVSSGRDAQVVLFAYDAILVAATMGLARRQGWPALNVLAYLLSGLTMAAWASEDYAPAKYLRTELFLALFCGMFLIILRETWRHPSAGSRLAAAVLATAPVLSHAASVALLFPHGLALLVYLIAFTAVGVIAANHWSWPWLRVAVLAAAAGPALGWVDGHGGPQWLVPGAVAIGAIYGLHLLAQLRVLASGEAPSLAELVLLHGNGLWLYGAASALLERHALAWLGTLAVSLAAWNGALATAVRRVNLEAALHFAALAFALAAVAVAVEFEGVWIAVGWAAEGAALVWLGTRVPRHWLRGTGACLLGLAVLRTVDALTGPGHASWSPLVNPRGLSTVFVVALTYALAALYREDRDLFPTEAATAIAVLVVLANALTVLLLTSEIDTAFRVRAWTGSAAGDTAGAGLGQQVALSTTWAAYALVLVAVGIRRDYAPVRYFAIALFALTIGKVFVVDLARLEPLHRILSTIALGVLLLAASYLYQRLATPRNGASPAS